MANQRKQLGDLKPLRPRRTAQSDVYIQLRNAILEAQFRPGELISLRALSEAFGVSTMPVREAASRLIAEGCLEALNNRGLRVPVLDDAKAAEILGLRRVLEGVAAEKAALRAKSVDVERLRQLEANLEKATDEEDLKAILRANTQFHLGLYQISDDKTLVDLIQILLLRYVPTFVEKLEKISSRQELKEIFHRKHSGIIDAVARNDGPSARAALIEDINGLVDRSF